MSKLNELFATAANPVVYANAFKAAVEQIQSALKEEPSQIVASLRERGQQLLDLADLVEAACKEDMEEEMKDKKGDQKDDDKKE